MRMNPVEVEHLPWDSDFFGCSVGRVILSEGGGDPEALKKAILKANCALTYVFLPVLGGTINEIEKPRGALVDLGGRCCDLKTVYRKTIGGGKGESSKGVVTATRMSSELEALAYASGWCSRFVSDNRLSKFFRPMYRKWLERDLARGMVFVYPSAEHPEGMVTASICDGLGKVGLVAVDAKSCGKGIATSLLADMEAWLASQGIHECEVVTQGVNVAARHLYEKVGFKLHSQMEVWHVWKA